MKSSSIARLVTALLFGGLFGHHIHNDYVKWQNLGRDPGGKGPLLNFGGQGAELWCPSGEVGFIRQMGHRFDLYMSSPRPAAFNVAVTAVLAVGVWVLIEFSGWAIGAIIERTKSPEKFVS